MKRAFLLYVLGRRGRLLAEKGNEHGNDKSCEQGNEKGYRKVDQKGDEKGYEQEVQMGYGNGDEKGDWPL